MLIFTAALVVALSGCETSKPDRVVEAGKPVLQACAGARPENASEKITKAEWNALAGVLALNDMSSIDPAWYGHAETQTSGCE